MTIAVAQRAVAHHVAGQDGLSFAHHRGAEKVRYAMILMLRGAVGGNDFQIIAPRFTLKIAGEQEHGAGIGLRVFGQSLEGRLNQRRDVGRLGQLEGQPAKLGGRPADLRNPAFLFFTGYEKFGLHPAMCNRRGFGGGEHTGIFSGVFLDNRSIRQSRATDQRARIGRKSLRQLMHKHQLCVPDADHVAGFQRPVADHHLLAHDRAVPAVQIAQRPLSAGHEHFHVRATATFVFNYDLVGRRTTYQHRLSRHKPKDVAPLTTFTNYKIS